MSNNNCAPTHMDQIEEALEERQTPDRRQQTSFIDNNIGDERRKHDRRVDKNKN